MINSTTACEKPIIRLIRNHSVELHWNITISWPSVFNKLIKNKVHYHPIDVPMFVVR